MTPGHMSERPETPESGEMRAVGYMHGLARLTPQYADPLYLGGYRLGKAFSGLVS